MSTAGDSIRLALRMRVSMSAMLSVIMAVCAPGSPARFLDARDQALQGHVPETDPAQAELAVDGAGPAAEPAAQADADPVPRLQLGLGRVFPGLLNLLELSVKLDVLGIRGHRGTSGKDRLAQASR